MSAVAGLRLVGNVLEFLDGSGDPRLRMTAPMLVDGGGERRELTIRVGGCSYSDDPVPPWGKRVMGPGASQCEVVVGWDAGATYPVMVDPSWTATGSPVQPRQGHSAQVLPDGRVLIIGGNKSPGTSEIWHNGTFAASSNPLKERNQHSTTLLPDGRVLVIGGEYSPNASEIWHDGVFSLSFSMVLGRLVPTASLLPDGRVLVVGGNFASKSSEIWKNGVFKLSASTTKLRLGHTATTLPDGRILIIGGSEEDSNKPTRATEIWENGVFVASGDMVQRRINHTATALPDGRVLVIGGAGDDVSPDTSEIWENGVFIPAGGVQKRAFHTANALLGGHVLVVGGVPPTQTSQLWGAGVFSAPEPMTKPRFLHTASVLLDGRVLVVGGTDLLGSNKTGEIWAPPKANGQPCEANSGCLSGFCVEGLCCDKACGGFCETCSSAKTGQPDGSCAPISPGTDLDNECVKDKAPGASCKKPSECSLGFCVDGVCCTVACAGQCESCDAQGLCHTTPAGKQPLGSRTQCNTGPEATCHGACDGVDTASCQYPTSTTLCPSTACTEEGLQPEGSPHFCRDIPGQMRLMGHVRSEPSVSPFDSTFC